MRFPYVYIYIYMYIDVYKLKKKKKKKNVPAVCLYVIGWMRDWSYFPYIFP